MNIPSDLGAGADGRPGVNHGACTHPRTDIHQRGHEHGTRFDESPVAYEGQRHRSKSSVSMVAPGRDLVVPTQRTCFDALHWGDPEIEIDGALDPVVNDPCLPLGLSHSQAACIQFGKCCEHGAAMRAFAIHKIGTFQGFSDELFVHCLAPALPLAPSPKRCQAAGLCRALSDLLDCPHSH